MFSISDIKGWGQKMPAYFIPLVHSSNNGYVTDYVTFPKNYWETVRCVNCLVMLN